MGKRRATNVIRNKKKGNTSLNTNSNSVNIAGSKRQKLEPLSSKIGNQNKIKIKPTNVGKRGKLTPKKLNLNSESQESIKQCRKAIERTPSPQQNLLPTQGCQVQRGHTGRKSEVDTNVEQDGTDNDVHIIVAAQMHHQEANLVRGDATHTLEVVMEEDYESDEIMANDGVQVSVPESEVQFDHEYQHQDQLVEDSDLEISLAEKGARERP